MKLSRGPIALSILAAISLAGCKTTPSVVSSEFERKMRDEGYVAYVPPVGNPLNGRLEPWRKYGPGAVVRKGRPDAVVNATHVIGEDGIQAARTVSDHAEVSLFSNTSVTGVNLNANAGIALAEAARIAGAANLDSSTEVEISFGPTFEAAPYDDLTLGKKLQENSASLGEFGSDLSRDRLHLVKSAVYTDSLRFTFHRRTASGGKVDVKIPQVQAAEIAASVSGSRVVDGGVVIDQPRFIAYRPFPEAKRFLRRNGR